MQYGQVYSAHAEIGPGPDRIYDQDAADPNYRLRPAGFVLPGNERTEVEPLLWDGDNA
jgi:hypothetical protein